ncbi:MAG: hypothetical protein HWE27_04555 [Gammaproteobacteria bacterium]|nr:hypothetical protein [Gammaproteobacteria bacterium]
MKKYQSLFFLAVLIASQCLQANNFPLREDEGLGDVVYRDIAYDKTLKVRAMSSDRLEAGRAIITYLVSWEMCDGGACVSRGTTITELMLHHPMFFIEWFSRNPYSQKRWLRSQDLIFNGFTEDLKFQEIVELKEKLIRQLKGLKLKSATKADFLNAYIDKLEKIEVPNYQ